MLTKELGERRNSNRNDRYFGFCFITSPVIKEHYGLMNRVTSLLFGDFFFFCPWVVLNNKDQWFQAEGLQSRVRSIPSSQGALKAAEPESLTLPGTSPVCHTASTSIISPAVSSGPVLWHCKAQSSQNTKDLPPQINCWGIYSQCCTKTLL